MNYMKAVIKSGPMAGFDFTEVKIPTPGHEEILVKIKVAAICGTDLHIIKWDRWAASRIAPPLIFGHEFAGEVVEVGSGVTELHKGDRVTGETHITCKVCFHCKNGQPHLCKNGRVIGIDLNGAFAEYIVFPAENAWKLEPDVTLEIGAVQNPLGNAVYAVISADVPGKKVAVVGCGPIGLYAVMVARSAGAAEIFAIDINAYRLELARSIGATYCINPSAVDPITTIMNHTDRIGVDLVVEVSGNPSGIDSAFAMVRSGGSVRLIGIPGEPVTIDLASRVIFPEIDVRGISGRELYRTYYQAFGLIKAGMDVTKVITHRLTFTDFSQGIDLMLSGDCGKVILEMEE